MKYCANCGKPMADNTKFCTSCGKSSDSIQNGPAEHQQNEQFQYYQENRPYPQNNFSDFTPQKKSSNAPLIIVSIIAALAVIVLVIVLLNNRDEQGSGQKADNKVQYDTEEQDTDEPRVLVTEPETLTGYDSQSGSDLVSKDRYQPINNFVDGLNQRSINTALESFPEEFENYLSEDISDLIEEVTDYDQLSYSISDEYECSQSELDDVNNEIDEYGICVDEAYHIDMDIYTSTDVSDTESAELIVGKVDGNWYIVAVYQFM